MNTNHPNALKFITCGSVDDGKSTLIGRLLVDTKAVLQDHLEGVQRSGQPDLALLTDGLSAEREQGITIDVAYRYFSTESRKFIIGDAPGHEQYTRNMVTAASSADAAVVLVDALKLDWRHADLTLLPQTRRHALLLQLLRVPSVIFAINKLDALDNPEQAYAHTAGAVRRFAQAAGIAVTAVVPISALRGWNVVNPKPDWCSYTGPSLLSLLEALPNTPSETNAVLSFPVQWVEKPRASVTQAAVTDHSRRVLWGRVATGRVTVGQAVKVFPSGQSAVVAQVLSATRQTQDVDAGNSAGVILDREVDVSRGDWLWAQGGAPAPQMLLNTTVAWLDDEPLLAGRVYWALHGHRWVKAKVQRVVHRLEVNTLSEEPVSSLPTNAIGHVTLALKQAVLTLPFAQSRTLGAMILVDAATHRTSGAVLVQAP